MTRSAQGRRMSVEATARRVTRAEGCSASQLLITCEHGGNRVPATYRHLFASRDELLASHRGWDPGALSIARSLARRTGAPLRYCLVTRLLVDVNRSAESQAPFSDVTRNLDPEEQQRLVARYHRPYWNRVGALVATALNAGKGAVHLSVHTFVPVLDGVVRNVDVGVLFDPDRQGEARFSKRLVWALREALPEMRVAENAPYHGASDGLTTGLRRWFESPRYLGIELELGQAIVEGPASRRRVGRAVKRALDASL